MFTVAPGIRRPLGLSMTAQTRAWCESRRSLDVRDAALERLHEVFGAARAGRRAPRGRACRRPGSRRRRRRRQRSASRGEAWRGSGGREGRVLGALRLPELELAFAAARRQDGAGVRGKEGKRRQASRARRVFQHAFRQSVRQAEDSQRLALPRVEQDLGAIGADAGLGHVAGALVQHGGESAIVAAEVPDANGVVARRRHELHARRERTRTSPRRCARAAGRVSLPVAVS